MKTLGNLSIRMLADILASRYASPMESAHQTIAGPDTWRTLLDETGARMEGDRVTGLPAPDPEAVNGAWVVPLADRAWLTCHGDDARRFLHDQLTAGVDDIGESEMRLAAYCGPQGRVLALFRVTAEAGGLCVELPASLADGVARRLGMFVLRADVRIDRATDLTAVGCWGETAPDVLDALDLPVPDWPFRQSREGQTTITRLPGPVPRFQLTGPPSPVTRAWTQWRNTASPANTTDWQYLDIRAGLPDIGPETTDQFLPQSLGLASWHALSFHKGCYPGQEVIARAHYRGRLKRHLYRARCEGPPPRPGTDILDDADKRAGSIIGAASEPGGGSALLAVMHERAAGEARLADGDRMPLLDLAPLPS